jgi:hypothetical protein
MVNILRAGLLSCVRFVVQVWPALDATVALSADDASIGAILGVLFAAHEQACKNTERFAARQLCDPGTDEVIHNAMVTRFVGGHRGPFESLPSF